jgi:hypothetical protein
MKNFLRLLCVSIIYGILVGQVGGFIGVVFFFGILPVGQRGFGEYIALFSHFRDDTDILLWRFTNFMLRSAPMIGIFWGTPTFLIARAIAGKSITLQTFFLSSTIIGLLAISVGVFLHFKMNDFWPSLAWLFVFPIFCVLINGIRLRYFLFCVGKMQF